MTGTYTCIGICCAYLLILCLVDAAYAYSSSESEGEDCDEYSEEEEEEEVVAAKEASPVRMIADVELHPLVSASVPFSSPVALYATENPPGAPKKAAFQSPALDMDARIASLGEFKARKLVFDVPASAVGVPRVLPARVRKVPDFFVPQTSREELEDDVSSEDSASSSASPFRGPMFSPRSADSSPSSDDLDAIDDRDEDDISRASSSPSTYVASESDSDSDSASDSDASEAFVDSRDKKNFRKALVADLEEARKKEQHKKRRTTVIVVESDVESESSDSASDSDSDCFTEDEDGTMVLVVLAGKKRGRN